MAKKKSRKVLYILLAVVAIMITTAVVLGRGKGETGTKVTAEKVAKRTIVETVSASGKIYPETELNVASDVSGEIVQLLVEEGDSIRKGQLLARIASDIYSSQVDRADATVNSSKAQLANAKAQISQIQAQIRQMDVQVDNAQRVYNRNLNLFNEKLISAADLENFESNLRTAKANRSSTQASVESARQSAEAAKYNVESMMASAKEARDNRAKTAIYAKSSGVISKLNVEKGERVVGTLQMAGTEIMRIADMSAMEVQVDVSENDVLRVSLRDEVEIEIDAYLDRIFTGKVTKIANSSSNSGVTGSTDQVTNFTVKIRLNPESYKDLLGKGSFPFRSGMSATVDIKTNTEADVLTVPIAAVTAKEEEDDKDTKKKLSDTKLQELVFICVGDSVVEQVIKTGIQDDEYIQVLEGLTGDEEIVSGPYTAISKTLKNGAKIRKVDEDELYSRRKKKK